MSQSSIDWLPKPPMPENRNSPSVTNTIITKFSSEKGGRRWASGSWGRHARRANWTRQTPSTAQTSTA